MLVGCRDRLAWQKPFIRGAITGGDSSRISVGNYGPGVEGCENSADVDIRETHIMWRDNVRRARKSDLTRGRVVSVWTKGPVLDSCPVQVQASNVVIEP